MAVEEFRQGSPLAFNISKITPDGSLAVPFFILLHPDFLNIIYVYCTYHHTSSNVVPLFIFSIHQSFYMFLMFQSFAATITTALSSLILFLMRGGKIYPHSLKKIFNKKKIGKVKGLPNFSII